MKPPSKTSLVLWGLLSLPGGAAALNSDRQQPIQIEAEQVEVDKPKGFSRYQGKVKFVQGSLVIQGDTVLLYHKKGVLDKVVIQGEPASFQQQPDEGEASIFSSANKIEYLAKQSRLFLYESAKVSQGNNSFAGETIEYDIVKGTVIANKDNEGQHRINAIIEPQEDDKPE